MSLSTTDDATEESQQKLEDDFNAFTTIKAQDLAQPLVDANIPFKIHIVKDHDMKERLCLEVGKIIKFSWIANWNGKFISAKWFGRSHIRLKFMKICRINKYYCMFANN